MPQHINLLAGTSGLEDAAVYRLCEDLALVQTVDFFPPILDDPGQYGAVAVANSLSDVYAMGGTPLTALNVLSYPMDGDRDVLAQILAGAYAKAKEADVLIVGGHTIDSAEPQYGLAVTGTVHPDRFVSLSTARPGDILVLTKPLGTGVITTAAKNEAAQEDVLRGAVESMLALNREASEVMMSIGVNACTDVTGFGLLGHLYNMVSASKVGAALSFSATPFLPGSRELGEEGFFPGGTHRNLTSLGDAIVWDEALSSVEQLLLCDAQTSGGLLMAVAPDRLDNLVLAQHQAGVFAACVVGQVTTGPSGRIKVSP